MDTRQLMVGDYILVDNEVCQVDAIWYKGSISYQGNDVCGDTDNPQPIPITTEFLEKNDFQEINKGIWSNFHIALFKLQDTYRVLYTHIDVKYVHELQHLYKLLYACDKEIKL